MMGRGFVCVLLATMACAQAPKPNPAATHPRPSAPTGTAQAAGDKTPAPSQVPLGAPVITLPGICDTPAADRSKADDCKTVITRAEFEKLIEVLAPTAAPAARRQLATNYASALVMVHAAHNKGLDQGPRYEELLKVMRIQVLTQELVKNVQESASHVGDKEVEDYYRQNGAAFEETELQRLFIPRTKQPADSKEKLSDEQAKKREQEGEEAMKKEAGALQARAAAGEDFDQLQKEAFTAGGLTAGAPSTKLGKVRRTALPQDQTSVMDLKPGEVSQVITAPSGYLVYKVGEKQTLPLDKVREEVLGTLRSQKMQDALQAIQQSSTPQLNEHYFVEAPSAPSPSTAQPEESAKPPAKPAEPAPK